MCHAKDSPTRTFRLHSGSSLLKALLVAPKLCYAMLHKCYETCSKLFQQDASILLVGGHQPLVLSLAYRRLQLKAHERAYAAQCFFEDILLTIYRPSKALSSILFELFSTCFRRRHTRHRPGISERRSDASEMLETRILLQSSSWSFLSESVRVDKCCRLVVGWKASSCPGCWMLPSSWRS